MTSSSSVSEGLSENEIRPDDLMEEQSRRYLADVARLLLNQDLFVEVDCPACNRAERKFVFEKYGINFVNCSFCETVYASPRPTQSQIDEYYQTSENYDFWNKYIFPRSESARREKIFKPRVDMVSNLVAKFGTSRNVLLEVGAGFGTFLEELSVRKVFEHCIAVEPTPELAKTCRSRSLKVLEKPVEQVSASDLSEFGGKADVIVSFEVIEHLFEPRTFIRSCFQLLDKSGLLILTCPNSAGFDIKMLGPLSGAVDTEHLNLFNLNSLALLLQSEGFEVVEKLTPGKLDAELVRKQVLANKCNLESTFLKTVLVEQFDILGTSFQEFLASQKLSSNMLLVGKKE